MRARRWVRSRGIWAMSLPVVAAAGCGLAASPARVAAPLPSVGAAIDSALPHAIAMIPLTEPDGTRTDLAAFRGRAVMIADFMTLCTDICPLISANTASIARSLARSGATPHTALLEITIDPHRDTLARLSAYQRLYGKHPDNWYLLRASPHDTRRLWRYFGVYTQRVAEDDPPDRDWLTGKAITYDIAHSDDVIFLNDAGRERFVIDGSPDAAGQRLPGALRRDLSPQGRRLLRHPDTEADWTTGEALRVFSWLLDERIGAT